MMQLTKLKVCAVGMPLLLALAGGHVKGALLSYNVVVTGTHNDSSHIQGPTFDNNLNASNFADFGQNTSGSGDWLTVAGAVGAGSLTLEHGVFRHAGNLPGGFSANYNGGSSQVKDPTVSIAALSSEITSDTAFYSGLPTTNTGSYNSSTNVYSINATGSGTKVFNIAGGALTNPNENIDVSLSGGSDAVIQVDDPSFSLGSSMHILLSGGTAAQVLWVFPNATTVSFNTLFEGSILAPKATLNDNSTDINGGVYVNNFDQTGEVHLGTFGGTPPPAPEPASLAVLAVGALGLLKRRARRS